MKCQIDLQSSGHMTFIQRRLNVDASTLRRRCINVICPLGIYYEGSIFLVTCDHYTIYDVHPSNSLQDTKQNKWTVKYDLRMIYVQSWCYMEPICQVPQLSIKFSSRHKAKSLDCILIRQYDQLKTFKSMSHGCTIYDFCFKIFAQQTCIRKLYNGVLNFNL